VMEAALPQVPLLRVPLSPCLPALRRKVRSSVRTERRSPTSLLHTSAKPG
jgi:hypothetical protein